MGSAWIWIWFWLFFFFFRHRWQQIVKLLPNCHLKSRGSRVEGVCCNAQLQLQLANATVSLINRLCIIYEHFFVVLFCFALFFASLTCVFYAWLLFIAGTHDVCVIWRSQPLSAAWTFACQQQRHTTIVQRPWQQLQKYIKQKKTKEKHKLLS